MNSLASIHSHGFRKLYSTGFTPFSYSIISGTPGVSYINGYTVLTFTGSGSFSVNKNKVFGFMVVGSGGNAPTAQAASTSKGQKGGGGGAGVFSNTAIKNSLIAGTTNTINVGTASSNSSIAGSCSVIAGYGHLTAGTGGTYSISGVTATGSNGTDGGAGATSTTVGGSVTTGVSMVTDIGTFNYCYGGGGGGYNQANRGLSSGGGNGSSVGGISATVYGSGGGGSGGGPNYLSYGTNTGGAGKEGVVVVWFLEDVLKTSSMNIQNWYNPDNATVTNGFVTAWNDSLGVYNLGNVLNAEIYTNSTGNSLTKVLVNGTTNAIYQQTDNYLSGNVGFSETVYSVMFCCNTTAYNLISGQYFMDPIVSNSAGNGNAPAIRYTVSTPPTMDTNDLNKLGQCYMNGILVQNGTDSIVLKPTSPLPSGYTIYCYYIAPAQQSRITQLALLGKCNDVCFRGYAGDFFIGNVNFGAGNQQQLEGYLGYKYKCQSSLPTSHPYYSATNSNIVTLTVGNTVVPAGGYRYFKFEILKVVSQGTMVQLSELLIGYNSTRLDYTGATATAINDTSSLTEGPTQSIDNNTATKWCNNVSTSISSSNRTALIIDFKTSKLVNCYTYTTANDSYDRDPKDFILYGSNDSLNWITLNIQTNFATSANRYYQLPWILF